MGRWWPGGDCSSKKDGGSREKVRGSKESARVKAAEVVESDGVFMIPSGLGRRSRGGRE